MCTCRARGAVVQIGILISQLVDVFVVRVRLGTVESTGQQGGAEQRSQHVAVRARQNANLVRGLWHTNSVRGRPKRNEVYATVLRLTKHTFVNNTRLPTSATSHLLLWSGQAVNALQGRTICSIRTCPNHSWRQPGEASRVPQ